MRTSPSDDQSKTGMSHDYSSKYRVFYTFRSITNMTQNNNHSDRLTRIETLVESNSRAIQALIDQQATFQLQQNVAMNEMRQLISSTNAIANSNSRSIQAMMEQETTNRLRHEEAMAKQDERLSRLEEVSSRLTEVQLGMARMLGNHDEDRPTILRRLMSIENKVDQILDRNPE